MKNTGDFILKSKHADRPFTADAQYIKNETAKPVVIFVHGFKGFKDWGHFNLIASCFAEAGFVFVKLNLSRNGTTPEHPVDFVDLEAFSENNFSIELDDIGVLTDALFNRSTPIPNIEMDLKTIHILGHSRGAAIALLKTYEDDRIDAVAAWAPVHDLKERWPSEVLEQWKKDGIYYVYNGRTKQNMPLKYQLVEDVFNHKDRLDIPNAVQRMNKPMLLVHGTNDETLHYLHTVQLAKLNSKAQLEIIEGANHVFGGKHTYTDPELPAHTQQALALTLNFFGR